MVAIARSIRVTRQNGPNEAMARNANEISVGRVTARQGAILAERTQRKKSRNFNEWRHRETCGGPERERAEQNKARSVNDFNGAHSESQPASARKPRPPAPRAARGIVHRQIAAAAIVPPYNCLI